MSDRSGTRWWASALLGCGVALMVDARSASSQSVGGAYSLTTQAAGGGLSVGGGYRVTGGLAAPGTGVASGGSFRLIGGLGGVFVVQTSGSPKLNAISAGLNAAVLTWEGDIGGYILEFIPAFGVREDWQPVSPQPTGNSFPVVCNQPARFYRLRRL